MEVITPTMTSPDDLIRLLAVDPEMLLQHAPAGPWDPLPEERANTKARRCFLVYLAMGADRKIDRLVAVLQAQFPEVAVGSRMLWEYSRTMDWHARAKQWDIAVSQSILPRIWIEQSEEFTRITLQHADDARLLQDVARSDLETVRDWQREGRTSEKPTTFFPSIVLFGALQTGQKLERQALGMNVREQILLGRLVPAAQRDELVRILNEAIEAYVPEEQRPAVREAYSDRVRKLESQEKVTP